MRICGNNLWYLKRLFFKHSFKHLSGLIIKIIAVIINKNNISISIDRSSNCNSSRNEEDLKTNLLCCKNYTKYKDHDINYSLQSIKIFLSCQKSHFTLLWWQLKWISMKKMLENTHIPQPFLILRWLNELPDSSAITFNTFLIFFFICQILNSIWLHTWNLITQLQTGATIKA